MLRAFVTVYLLLCLRVLQADWEVKPGETKEVHACEGDDATFPWQYNGSNLIRGIQIKKIHPTKVVMVNRGSRQENFYIFTGITFQPNAGMRIKKVDAGHTGKYECTVVFKKGGYTTGDAELKVHPLKDCPSTWFPSVVVSKVDNSESKLTMKKNASLVYSTGQITFNISTVIPRATPPVNCIIQKSSNGDKIDCMGSTEDELTCTQTLEFKENGTFEIEVTFTHVAKPPATKMIKVFIGIDAPNNVDTTPGNRHNTMGIALVVVFLVIGAGLLTIAVMRWKYGRCCGNLKINKLKDISSEQGEPPDNKNEIADDTKTAHTGSDLAASETMSLLTPGGADNQRDQFIGSDISLSPSNTATKECKARREEFESDSSSQQSQSKIDNNRDCNNEQNQTTTDEQNVTAGDSSELGTIQSSEADKQEANKSAAPTFAGREHWRDTAQCEDDTTMDETSHQDSQELTVDSCQFADCPQQLKMESLIEKQPRLLSSIATQLKGDECLYKTVRDARSHIYSKEAVGSAMAGKLKVSFSGAIEKAKYKKFNRLDQDIHVPRFVPQTHQIAKDMKKFVSVLLEHLAEEHNQDYGALDTVPIHVGRFEYDWKTLYLDDFTFRCIVQPIYKEDDIEVITGGPEVRQEHGSRLITIASHFLHLTQLSKDALSQTPESGDSIINLEQNESAVSIKLTRKCCCNHLHNIKVNVIFGYSIPGNSPSELILKKNVILQSRNTAKKRGKREDEVFVVPTEKHWFSGREMDLVISKLCNKASPYTNNVFRVFTVIIKHFFKVADDNFQVEEKDNFCNFINDSPNVWILETILFEIVLDHSDKVEWGQTKLVSRLTEMLSKLLPVKELDGHMYWPDVNDMYNTTEMLGIDLGKHGSQLHTSLKWYLEGLEKLIDFIENTPDGWKPRMKAEVVKKVSSVKDNDYQLNEYTNHPWIQWCEQYHQESIASMSDDNGKKAQLVIKEGSSVSNQDTDIDELALMFEKMPVKNDEIDVKSSSVYYKNRIYNSSQ